MRNSILVVTLVLTSLTACNIEKTKSTPVSTSGVSKATVQVKTGSDGLTVEQRNIAQRLKTDNKIGSIKHLYVLSAMTGDVILYSTVKGKVTSSGKRLSPTSVTASQGQSIGSAHNGMAVNIGGAKKYTSEVLQDDGTYGSSIPYLYWYDTKGIQHQQYVVGGQIIHISETPLRAKKAIIQIEK